MKVGFIGLGRMGSAMARRLIDGKHDVGVYNRSPDKLKPLTDAGAKPLDSIKAAATYGDAVFTMLADDAALLEVVSKPGGYCNHCRKAAFISAPARIASRRSKTSRSCTPTQGKS